MRISRDAAKTTSRDNRRDDVARRTYATDGVATACVAGGSGMMNHATRYATMTKDDGAREDRQHCPEQPHHSRVDFEILREASAHAAKFPVGRRPGQALGSRARHLEGRLESVMIAHAAI